MRPYWITGWIVVGALAAYCASVWVPIGDCEVVSSGDERLCPGPDHGLSAYLAQNVMFLKKGPPSSNEGAAVEADPKVVINALTFGSQIKQNFTETLSDSTGVLPGIEEFAAGLAKVELARAQVFARDLTAWLTISSAETAARVFWMFMLGAITIALIGLAGVGVGMAWQAMRALTNEPILSRHSKVVVAIVFVLIWLIVGMLSYFELDLFFLETWPARFVERELRGDLPELLRLQYFLLGFGAAALLTGVSFRLVMPTDVVAKETDEEKTARVRRARLWLLEASEGINRAILVVAATLVLGVLYVYAILSWPLALVGGCGENQILPEVLAACGIISHMVMGTGLLGSLVLGAIVLPANMFIRGYARRLATEASVGTESTESEWLEEAGLADSYWGMIGRVAAVLAPLLPGLFANLATGLATLAS
jgi:hypothetical protein